MFLAYSLLVVALVAQVVTFEALLDDATISIGVVSIWYVASILTTLFLSASLFQASMWLFMKRLRPALLARYRHWGMEEEVLGHGHILYLIVSLAWCLGTLSLTFVKAASVVEQLIPGSGDPMTLILTWVMVFFITIYWRSLDYGSLSMKRKKLDDLHPFFHKRFQVSEILSMYECLRGAPAIFWEEYTKLGRKQINEASNRKFRERVAPYSVHRTEVTQRTILLITVVAVFIAVPTLLNILVEGEFLWWLQQEIFN